MASELESVVRRLGQEVGGALTVKVTIDWDRKWFADFNAGKSQLTLFDRSNNAGAIDVKMDGSVLEEKSSFKMLGLSFSSKYNWG